MAITSPTKQVTVSFPRPPIQTQITNITVEKDQSRLRGQNGQVDEGWSRWFGAVQTKLSNMLTPSGFMAVDGNVTAPIGTSTLLAVPATGAGFYRVTFFLETSVTGAAGTVSGSVFFNDGVAAQTLTTTNVDLTVLGAYVNVTFNVYSAASQNITYSTLVVGGAGASYIVRVRMEYIGA